MWNLCPSLHKVKITSGKMNLGLQHHFKHTFLLQHFLTLHTHIFSTHQTYTNLCRVNFLREFLSKWWWLSGNVLCISTQKKRNQLWVRITDKRSLSHNWRARTWLIRSQPITICFVFTIFKTYFILIKLIQLCQTLAKTESKLSF